jgi:hypothetical protein
MEEKEYAARDKANRLLSEFEKRFRSIKSTYHPVDLPGEIAGKSANVAWAARKIIDDHVEHSDNVIITVIDGQPESSPQLYQTLTFQSRYPFSLFIL